jgi:hypothetical protein
VIFEVALNCDLPIVDGQDDLVARLLRAAAGPARAAEQVDELRTFTKFEGCVPCTFFGVVT